MTTPPAQAGGREWLNQPPLLVPPAYCPITTSARVQYLMPTPVDS
jgi:hypothetical protein